MPLIDSILGKVGLARRSTLEAKQGGDAAAKIASIISRYGQGAGGVAADKSYSQLVGAYRSWVYTCLRGSELVRLADGSCKMIREIVSEKWAGEVLSFSQEKNKIVPCQVIGWHKSPLGDRRWMRVSFASGQKQQVKYKKKAAWVTDDHRFLTKRGYVAAKDLNSDDLLATTGEGNLLYAPAIAECAESPDRSTYCIDVEENHNFICKDMVLHNCIDRIAKDVAVIPLKLFVYRREGRKIIDPGFKAYLKTIETEGERKYYLKQVGVEKQEIFEHPFLQLIQRPNGNMTRMLLWYHSMVKLELAGMFAWYTPKNRLRIPGEIWPLPLTRSASIEPKVDGMMRIEQWTYRDGDLLQKFDPSEIKYFHYPSPAGPFKAMSPLLAQTYPYDIDLFLMQQQRALFENGAFPGQTLSTDQNLTRGQIQEIIELINTEYGGPRNYGKTQVYHSGLKPTDAGMVMSGKDMMLDVVANFSKEKLITSFDLSEGKLGLVKDVNRANGDFLDATYVKACLKPRCMLIEEVIETFMLPDYDQGLTCDFQLPDTEDRELMLKEKESRLGSLETTVNEERSRRGEKPVPWGDVPWIPFNLMPWSPNFGKAAAQGAGDGKGSAAPEARGDEKALDGQYWTEDRKIMLWKQFVSTQEALQRPIEALARDHFSRQLESILGRLQREGKAIEGTYAGWARSKVEQHLKGNPRVKAINIDQAREAEILAEQARPMVLAIMHEYGRARMRDLFQLADGPGKAAFGFNVNDPRVIAWLGARMLMFSEEVEGTTFEEIARILRLGFAEGQPLPVIADTLREKFRSWDKYRAPLIARTETIAGMNTADLQAANQSEMRDLLRKHWLSARDGACRDTHREADQRYEDKGLTLDEMYQVGADAMLNPGAGKTAEENINCRCTQWYTQIKSKEPAGAVKPPEPAEPDLVKAEERVLFQRASQNTREMVQSALGAIAKVHKIPAGAKIIVKDGAGRAGGVYDWVKIGISKTSRVKAYTMAHETAHWIDNQMLIGNIGKRFASEIGKDVEMVDLMATIRKSRSHKELEALKGKRFVEVNRGGVKIKMVVSRNHLNYCLEGKELFARAYAQWIANKSSSPEMLRGLNVWQWDPRVYKYAWDNDDFEPIIIAFDRLFKKKGWLVKE